MEVWGIGGVVRVSVGGWGWWGEMKRSSGRLGGVGGRVGIGGGGVDSVMRERGGGEGGGEGGSEFARKKLSRVCEAWEVSETLDWSSVCVVKGTVGGLGMGEKDGQIGTREGGGRGTGED